ncbi:MAG: flagellar biosynthetic protein FliO [Gallionella sp.]
MTPRAATAGITQAAKFVPVPSRSKFLLSFFHLKFLALSIAIFQTLPAAAADLARPAYAPPPTVVTTGSVVQIVISLVLVLAAIVAVAWVLKRMNVARQGTANLLKVIGGVSVGQRERVVLVEVLDSWLVVGVGPGQIRTLHVLEKPADSDLTSNTPTGNQQPSNNKFSALLATVLSQQPGNRKHDAP